MCVNSFVLNDRRMQLADKQRAKLLNPRTCEHQLDGQGTSTHTPPFSGSAARIDGSGRGSTSFDVLTRVQTQILAKSARNDLHADRSVTQKSGGDRQPWQT